jgi:flagellin
MSLIINTNIASLTAQNNLGINNSKLQQSIERLSSGLRVNSARDDAAGLAIANKLNFQSRGLNQAVRNAGDATSLVQTAEGAFNVTTNILGRLRELAVQAASDTNTASDRATLKSESDQLVAELTRLATTTQFNGANLLDGSFASGKIQVGANADQTISFSLADVRAAQLGKFAAFSTALASGIADGVFSTGGAGNFTAGEFTINSQLVGATTTTDDQVSVLTLNTQATATVGAVDGSTIASGLVSGTKAIYINGTLITGLTAPTGTLSQTSEFTNALVAKINSAGIANVTARENSGQTRVIIEASKGTDIRLAFSDAAGTGGRASYASALGIASSFFGATQGSANEVSDFNGQSSAIAKAAAINSVQSKSGVVATVETTNFSNTAAVAVGSVAANSFYINGTAVDATTGITGNDGTGALRAAINAKTSSTGVTATVNTSGFLVLSAADGRNISLYVDSGATTATGLTQGANVYRSSLKFASNNSVTFAGSTTDVGGLNTNSPYTPDLNNSLSLIDISTQSGANTALTSIDAALQQVSQSAANVGALQNRLDLTVQSLQTAAQNQTAAESRIRDADFAYETSQFTRNQILVQAGTAILAQANSSTQIALQLLK